jgi:hypothetical protein
MRQIVSLVKDERVQFALVDTEAGTMSMFAEVHVPPTFGINEAVTLGTNLIEALGLNGAQPVSGGDSVESPPETARQRRNRLAREKYHRDRTRTPPRKRLPPMSEETRARMSTRTSKASGARYIPDDELLGVLAEYPEGLRTRDLSTRMWRLAEGQGSDGVAPHWFHRAVENRVNRWLRDERDGGRPSPIATQFDDAGRRFLVTAGQQP